MAHLYANENFPRKVVEALRKFGHNILTVQEAGKADQGISDEEVLAFAIEQNRTVITINRRDFIRLHTTQPNHAGIIVCTQDADTDGQAERIHQTIISIEDLTGQLLRVNRPQR
jgi:predicted nuclease of predicted toxin-antitoxin system